MNSKPQRKYRIVLLSLIMIFCLSLVSCLDEFIDLGSSQSSSSSTSSSEETETESSESSSSQQESEESSAYEYFTATVTAKTGLNAYPYTADSDAPEGLEGVYYSTSAPGAEPVKDGTGKIWLVLKPTKNYYVSSVKIEGKYSSVENLGKDIYCIHGVSSDLKINPIIGVMASASSEIFEDFGYGISDDGVLTVTWKEATSEPLRYVELKYKTSKETRTEYVDASTGKAEFFKMTENVIYDITVRAIGYEHMGQSVEFEACFMEAPKSVAFPRVEITTQDYVWPSCDFVSSPDGCWGAGITNAFYEQCMMTVYDENNDVVYDSTLDKNENQKYLGAKMKIRGNTSARYAPKGRYPYKIKLDSSFDLLEPLIGRPDDGKAYADKDWVLLNYGNEDFRICGDAIADAVGTAWSPDYCYVTLYVNGEYRGLYVLSEAVEVGNGTGDEQARVTADETGFLFECDAYWWNEDLYFSTPMTENTPMYFTFKSPDSDEITETSESYLYLKNYMIEFENALKKNDDSYLEYIDLDSFVKWLLVSDYLCINDGGGCNIYLYKVDSTDETKVCMGPNWDFDSYMGDVEALSTIRVYWSTAPFYYHQLIKKESFQKRYKELFNETYGELDSYIDEAYSQIDEEAHTQLQEYDKIRFGTSVKSLSEQKATFTEWLDAHIEWMEPQFK